MPVSSNNSRDAVCVGNSPNSMCPPGGAHVPAPCVDSRFPINTKPAGLKIQHATPTRTVFSDIILFPLVDSKGLELKDNEKV